MDLEIGSVAHPDHQPKGLVEIIKEGFLSPGNPTFIETFGPPIV